ncbi:hypothetical protein E8E13_004326 [Curvularia kusanoi]|uniref:Asl1-like glycosyl hydrolase catalytic domain-containing protein n=1 Tax=Curvularia kusanoi TaxID=90978 RepID=A0A9P4WCT1_CURKU|nr:hypothetical protein E8E13_004326 [Curvularia kusanoi]
MSSMTKISLLALIGAAAAHPSYGAHSKFHAKAVRGAAYPTGGWSGNYNSTQVPAGTAATGSTTTVDVTSTSTTTLYTTVYGSKPSQSAVVENVGSYPAGPVGAESKPAGAQCGPATVTVTASEKVTVTVTPGVSTPYSAGVVSSSIALPSSKVGQYDVSSIVVAPTPSAEKPVVASSKAPEYSPYTPPAYTPVPSSAAPVTSSAAQYSSAVPSSVVAPSSAAPSSSAAPKPSGAPTYSGSKRGLAYNDGELCSSFGKNFGFAYNWGQTESKDVGAPFVPMMHKPQDSSAEAWLANVDKSVKAGSKAVMGFNEPDIAAQANMSPEAACSAWKEYMNPIASAHPEVTILGPSVSNSGSANQGLQWLDQFHSSCPDAVVHASNIHFYDIYEEATIDRFKAHVEKAAAKYGKPVWVTEFGLNPGSATEDQAAAFLKQAMDYCDGSEHVQGYSYFMVGTGENQLNNGSGLSKVGQVYASS